MLILQTRIVRIEVFRAVLAWTAVFLIFPHIRQSIVDELPLVSLQKWRCDLIVRINELLCLLGIGILEISVRIGELQ